MNVSEETQKLIDMAHELTSKATPQEHVDAVFTNYYDRRSGRRPSDSCMQRVAKLNHERLAIEAAEKAALVALLFENLFEPPYLTNARAIAKQFGLTRVDCMEALNVWKRERIRKGLE
jgi:hypothetical protein